MRPDWPVPPKLDLARLGTPLQPVPRASAALGVELLVKRDDTTGAELSGNKVRKLEFLLAEAIACGADTVITCGGEQSNHARATALAAARLGLASELVLRCDDPAAPPATAGNILLDHLAGARLRWITRAAWRDRNQLMAAVADELRAAGRRPYVIPEGGSNALGSWGYVGCAAELDVDLAALPPRPTTIVYACGSGGTGAGLVVGAALLGWAARGIRVAAINVCDDRAYFVDAIGRIARDLVARWQLGVSISDDDLTILDGHVGLGYARSRPEELATLRQVARRDGLVLDPVYTGKAFHGLVQELTRRPGALGERVVFVHTGGVFGLFADPAAVVAG
ncbi:MAG: D-cysteine desulfhydrase family protein [Kofleriaceae bacterium]